MLKLFYCLLAAALLPHDEIAFAMQPKTIEIEAKMPVVIDIGFDEACTEKSKNVEFKSSHTREAISYYVRTNTSVTVNAKSANSQQNNKGILKHSSPTPSADTIAYSFQNNNNSDRANFSGQLSISLDGTWEQATNGKKSGDYADTIVLEVVQDGPAPQPINPQAHRNGLVMKKCAPPVISGTHYSSSVSD